MRRLAPNGWPAQLILSFAGTAGILYVNIMPALVDALQVALGFSPEAAGRVGSLNTYGGAFGALCMAAFGRRLPWRATLLSLAAGLIIFDLLSIRIATPWTMMAVRFVHGTLGGGMVAMAYLVISRVSRPSRTFALVIALQYGAYMVSIVVLPVLVRSLGMAPLFLVLVAFSALTMALILFLPDYPETREVSRIAGAGGATEVLPRLLALASVVLFQAGNMAVNAYIVGLGQSAGLTLRDELPALSAAGLAGLMGSVAVVLLPSRSNPMGPVIIAISMALLGILGLLQAGDRAVWLLASVMNGFAWGATLPLLIGLCASMDRAGSGAMWSSFMSKLGLASGPMLGSFVIGSPPRYAALIIVGAVLTAAALAAAVGPMAVRRLQ
ncbi:MAG TPA: MFS transporter [Steroidobacteraceae bacterium]